MASKRRSFISLIFIINKIIIVFNNYYYLVNDCCTTSGLDKRHFCLFLVQVFSGPSFIL